SEPSEQAARPSPMARAARAPAVRAARRVVRDIEALLGGRDEFVCQSVTAVHWSRTAPMPPTASGLLGDDLGLAHHDVCRLVEVPKDRPRLLHPLPLHDPVRRRRHLVLTL